MSDSVVAGEHPKRPESGPSGVVLGFKGRLQEAIGTRSIRKLAEGLTVSEGTLRSYLRGDTYPDLPVMEELAHALGVSAVWLAFGIGGPETDTGRLADQDRDFVRIPVYDIAASAGPGAALTDERIVNHVMFRKDYLTHERLNAASLGMIGSRGDSMPISAPDGALLLVDISERTVVDNGIYVLRLDHHLLVKRLQRFTDGSIDVISENPAYVTERIAPQRVGDLDVVGKVKLSSHRV